MPNLIYLAQPYTHPDELVRQTRHAAARATAARMMDTGKTVFSPIVHGVGLEQRLAPRNRTNHEFWMRQCLAILRRCEAMYVLPLVGWRDSRGLAEELTLCSMAQIPVTFLADYPGFRHGIWADLDIPDEAAREARNWEIEYEL